jgi:peptide-methionine (S)-S-oxide reductase
MKKNTVLLFAAAVLMAFSSLVFAVVNINSAPMAKTKDGMEIAIFAGGCFWCMESDFDKVKGVISTTSGYTGGKIENPTYEQVSAGGTGHAESVMVKFDPKKVSYANLLKTFWLNIDPLTPDRQFCDSGTQYRSAIFYLSESQKIQAEAYKASLEKSKFFKQPIVTEINAGSAFYPAEEYHQDYHSKNPIRYNYYRNGCGRDARLKEVWGSQK